MRPSTLALFAIALCGSVQAQNGTVQHTGAMRNTMFNGQLSALVGMDSVAAPGVYGIGPLAFLRGELLVVDGRCYVATATSDSSMQVVERSDAGAPFFVQQEVHAWRPVALPDGVTDLRSLDGFLTAEFGALQAPFAFRMSGVFRSVQLHLVAVPPGTEVHGPGRCPCAQQELPVEQQRCAGHRLLLHEAPCGVHAPRHQHPCACHDYRPAYDGACGRPALRSGAGAAIGGAAIGGKGNTRARR
jgi:hypothetical protein